MARPQEKLSPPIIVALLVLGAMALVYLYVPALPPQEEEQSAPVYKTLTVDADGSVNKQTAILSQGFLDRLPERFLRYFIFGVRPELIRASKGPLPPFESEDMVTAVFSVQNSPDDVRFEYQEYFEAIGAPAANLSSMSANDIFVWNGGIYVFVSTQPHARGSEVRVSLIPSPQFTPQP